MCIRDRYRPNEKGITGAHAAAPIWGLIMEGALKSSEMNNFPVPKDIKFQYANVSDGYYEPKSTKETVKVALNKRDALPMHPTNIVVSKVEKRFEVVKLDRKPLVSHQVADKPIKVKHDLENIDSKIWFMLNLENASMGKLNKIPTTWFIEMLRDTKNVETNSPKRLMQGRKVLIEKLFSRTGSFDKELVQGVSIKNLLQPGEADALTLNPLTEN